MKILKILILILAVIVIFINTVPSISNAKYVIECEIVAANVEVQNTNSHYNSTPKNKNTKSSAKAQNKGKKQTQKRTQKKTNAKPKTQKKKTKTNKNAVNNSARIDQYKQKVTQKGKVKTYIIRN